MRVTLKACLSAAGVLLVAAAVSLIIAGREPLYGQADNDNWVPDLTGTWTSEVDGYFFDDVTVAQVPQYFVGSLDRDLQITHQTGRTFAGHWTEPGGASFKLTGVMLPDRTVSLLYFEPSEERIFITGRLSQSGGMLEITGYLHYFDELTAGSGKNMASGYIRLMRVP